MGWKSPLGGGNPNAFTCSIFRLDPTGTLPLEPLIDIVPGLTPLRTTFDMIDNETLTLEYDITEHAVQGHLAGTPAEITSHIRKRLEKLTVAGTLAAKFQPTVTPVIPGLPVVQATPPILPGVPFQPSMPPQPDVLVRLDLLRFENLKAIADAERPVMVVTPRYTMIPAGIELVSENWSPPLGEQLKVQVSFKEVRVVTPIAVDAVADYGEMLPGNNADASGGAAAQDVSASVTPGDAPGVAPTVGASAGGA